MSPHRPNWQSNNAIDDTFTGYYISTKPERKFSNFNIWWYDKTDDMIVYFTCKLYITRSKCEHFGLCPHINILTLMHQICMLHSLSRIICELYAFCNKPKFTLYIMHIWYCHMTNYSMLNWSVTGRIHHNQMTCSNSITSL